MNKLAKIFLLEESGQGLVEYALILMLIAFVVFASVGALGEKVAPIFTNVENALEPNVENVLEPN